MLKYAMGPELELKARGDGVTTLCIKENGGLSSEYKEEHLNCESNSADYVLEMENSRDEPLLADRSKDVEVNITEFTTSDGNGLVKAECQDATESLSSSSFDDTASGSGDPANSSDAEVGSYVRGYNSTALEINGFAHKLRMRKRKLTSHWRTFIQPLIWRCKWAELQVKKLRSQAVKYDRELANQNQRKHSLVENFPVEGLSMKSLPFPSDGPRDKVFKRKKRRRVEDTTDVKSYMSNHNLFSFYENRILTADGPCVDKDWGNQVNSTDKINGNNGGEVNGERLWLESGNSDNSLEELLKRIGLLEAQVSRLRARLVKVQSQVMEKCPISLM